MVQLKYSCSSMWSFLLWQWGAGTQLPSAVTMLSIPKCPQEAAMRQAKVFILQRGWVNEVREILKILGKGFLGFCLKSLSCGQPRLF